MAEDDRLIRQVAETIGAVFWLADANEPRILYVSSAYEQIWGRDRQRLYTHYNEFFESIHPDDRERVRSATSLCALQEQFEVEYRIVRPDGEVRWVRDRGFLICDQNGAPDRIAGFAEDITDRNRTETALRESEARYRSLFNSMDEAYAVVEVLADDNGEWNDFLFLEVNPAFVKQTGMEYPVRRKATELLGRPNPHWAQVYGRVAETGEPIRFEEGEATLGRVFDLYVFRLGEDGSRRVAVLFTDITDRKRAEEALRESEEQQAFLLKFSDALRAEPDADAVANRALRMLSEQMQLDRCYIGVYRLADDRGDFTHQVGNDRVPPLPDGVRLSDFPKSLRVAFDRTLVINDIAEIEGLIDADRQNLSGLGLRALVAATLRKGENNPLWSIVSVSAHPRRWTRGEIALVEEVTERTWAAMERARAEASLRESEEQYRTLNQQLEQRVSDRTAQLQALNHELEAFSHSISHDLKTPLNYITMVAGLLPQQLDLTLLDETSLRYLNVITQSASQTGAMVDDLLEFSQMGQAEMRWTTVQMNPLVQQVQQQLLPEIAGRSIDWQIEPLPDGQGDATMLRLVWQNLLANALKYSRDRSKAIITIGSRESDTETIFFIQDNGAGFDMKYRDRLFGMFQRLHPQEHFGGTGVGLANVRRIIHRHGGRTWAEGAIDRGATLYFSLPKQKDQA